MTRVLPGDLPALGDLRALRSGDTIVVHPAALNMPGWPRYVAAITDAVAKGAAVIWEDT